MWKVLEVVWMTVLMMFIVGLIGFAGWTLSTGVPSCKYGKPPCSINAVR